MTAPKKAAAKKCVACGKAHDPKRVCKAMKELRAQNAAVNKAFRGLLP